MLLTISLSRNISVLSLICKYFYYNQLKVPIIFFFSLVMLLVWMLLTKFLSSQRIQFERCVHRIMVLIVLGTYRIFRRSSAAICSSGSWKWQHAESIWYGSNSLSKLTKKLFFTCLIIHFQLIVRILDFQDTF